MQTIGERLEEARKNKGISIRDAAEATKIRSDYLHKFESNQFDIGLAEIYRRGFLRTYAIYLQLPAEKILSDYTALTRGQNSGSSSNGRSSRLSREVFVRMDLSSSAGDNERASSPAAAPQATLSDDALSKSAPPSALPNKRGETSRSGTNLPKLPAIPPQWIFRGGIALGSLVALLLLYWAGSALFGSGKSDGESGNAGAGTPTVSATADTSFSLIATNTVRVKVTRRNADDSAGEVLLDDITLNRGDRRTLTAPGPVYIWASEGGNLKIEKSGREYPMPFSGYNRAKLN